MNEDLYSAGWHQICETLLAIRKQRDWGAYVSFEQYASKRWGLSKTRANLFCKFAMFVNQCRESRLPTPDVPDNLEPLLKLAQKHWLDAWTLCVDLRARTKGEIEAVLDRFGYVRNKRQSPQEMDNRAARRAGESLSKIKDVDGVLRPGKDWTEGDVLRKAAVLAEKAHG